ncbi:CDP-diacylglycerol--glycerol-3-phosphate 3-phosphatidyltransferase [Saccharibacillus sp. CPCC 101409]|uniref:CDP-diacylglycerol--glycerol-3-phosphate 3-phosphatidyltransferase n=1 Tax=Saccharibacillus sp. CPCC 101409 TaxID=3058041 RepID=UPI002672464F|nr:CDP-diacylglycerol--glycerol-3-phosphate 3-phosphatidyltransferase [Saccharibacillus sp. CPCC 101409]MDO3410636.1 CDP-diacylglycerol--glycerol-3-phosphate 3-phosphatidyltransferase [Saccharibacillus sp. CPCC 101409]
MNLPNRITLSRIVLIPVMMVFLLADLPFLPDPLVWGGVELSWGQLIACIIFIAASCTDGIDGYIARSRNLVTNLGKLLDPLADKLLVSAAFISLVQLDKLAAWIAIVIISREFAVTGLRQIALLDGAVMAAGAGGKIKTVLQIVAIALLLLNNLPFEIWGIPADTVFVWAALVATVYSGVDYFWRNRKLLRES